MLQRSFQLLLSWTVLHLVAFSLTACQRAPLARPEAIMLRVQFLTQQGVLLRGGWVESVQGKQPAPEGTLDLALPFHQRGQHVVAQCPLLYTGATERHLSASTLSAGGKMEITVLCQPLQRITGLSVRSDCPDAQIFLNDQALGQLKQGWFQALLTENQHAPTSWAHDRSLRLVARADHGCRFIDPVTARPVAQLELTLSLTPSTRALWTELRGIAQPRSVRRPPQKSPRRPYRL